MLQVIVNLPPEDPELSVNVISIESNDQPLQPNAWLNPNCKSTDVVLWGDKLSNEDCNYWLQKGPVELQHYSSDSFAEKLWQYMNDDLETWWVG